MDAAADHPLQRINLVDAAPGAGAPPPLFDQETLKDALLVMEYRL